MSLFTTRIGQLLYAHSLAHGQLAVSTNPAKAGHLDDVPAERASGRDDLAYLGLCGPGHPEGQDAQPDWCSLGGSDVLTHRDDDDPWRFVL